MNLRNSLHTGDKAWLWNPGQTSPEVQNWGISGATKRTNALQKVLKKEEIILLKKFFLKYSKKIIKCEVAMYTMNTFCCWTSWFSNNLPGWTSWNVRNQECIPVGCVPPTRCCTGGLPERPPLRGQTDHHITPLCPWTDKHLWKHYLRKVSFAASKYQ